MNKLEKLRLIIDDKLKARGVTEFPLTEDTVLADSGLDSLDLVELSMEIEDEFKVTISETTFRQCKTVGDVLALI